jgi:hypothetical protein
MFMNFSNGFGSFGGGGIAQFLVPLHRYLAQNVVSPAQQEVSDFIVEVGEMAGDRFNLSQPPLQNSMMPFQPAGSSASSMGIGGLSGSGFLEFGALQPPLSESYDFTNPSRPTPTIPSNLMSTLTLSSEEKFGTPDEDITARREAIFGDTSWIQNLEEALFRDR